MEYTVYVVMLEWQTSDDNGIDYYIYRSYLYKFSLSYGTVRHILYCNSFSMSIVVKI